jgi:hypothetical protein
LAVVAPLDDAHGDAGDEEAEFAGYEQPIPVRKMMS